MDGAPNGNLGPVAMGGIIWHRDGTLIKGFTHFLGAHFSNNYVETMEILLGITLAIDMGFFTFMIKAILSLWSLWCKALVPLLANWMAF